MGTELQLPERGCGKLRVIAVVGAHAEGAGHRLGGEGDKLNTHRHTRRGRQPYRPWVLAVPSLGKGDR